MIGLIGQVDRFVINSCPLKFTRYRLSFDEIKNIVLKSNLSILETENNKLVKQKIDNSIPADAVNESKMTLEYSIGTYFDSNDKIVKTGKISNDRLKLCLARKPIKYCYCSPDGEICLSKELPNEKIEYVDLQSTSYKEELLDTNLYLELEDKTGTRKNIPISAYFEVPTLDKKDTTVENEFLTLQSNLEDIVNAQKSIKYIHKNNEI